MRICEARDDTRERFGPAGVDGLGDQPRHVDRRAGAFELYEPDAALQLALERARRLEGQPALADPGQADERHQPVLVQQLGQPGALLLPVDEGAGRRRQVAAARRRDRDGGDRGVLDEDRLLQPPQGRPRLERKPVRQHTARLLERLERVGLAAAAIEREHQLAPQPLAEGFLLQRGAQRRHQLALLAERERRLELAPRARRCGAPRAAAPRS